MKFKKVFLVVSLLFLFFFTNISKIDASTLNNVNVYLFYSDTCPHCHKEQIWLEEFLKDNENVFVYKYEIKQTESKEALTIAEGIFNSSIKTVPYTIIGDKEFFGFNESSSKKTMENYIEYFSHNGYEDKLGSALKIETLPTYEITDISFDEYMKEKQINNTEYVINIPFIGKIDLKNLALPIVSILIGLIDGFNPCAMWILLFLISMLMGMEDRKKMWILGITFLLTSALIYLAFMLAWLNFATYITSITLIRNIIGLIAIGGGLVNLFSYIKQKEDGCNVVDDKKRNKIFARIRKIIAEKNFLLALGGIILLAASVNVIELACSAGLPVMFTNLLALNNLNTFEYSLYIFLYILFFLMDDLIVFIIAMISMKLTGISTKYGKLSHLIGGIVLVSIGVLMIVKPEWLMFNF